MEHILSSKDDVQLRTRAVRCSDIAEFSRLQEEHLRNAGSQSQDFERLRELSLLGVAVVSVKRKAEEIVGFAFFDSTHGLTVPALGGCFTFIEQHGTSLGLHPNTTIVLTCFLAKPSIQHAVLRETLRVLFSVDPRTEACLYITLTPWRSELFPAWFEIFDQTSVHVSICPKEHIYPPPSFRSPTFEDSPKIREHIGSLDERLRDYLNAQWLENLMQASSNTTDSTVFEVVEGEENAFGFYAATTRSIDWKLINQNYQTEIFHHFRKVTDFDRVAGKLSRHNVDIGGSVSDAALDPVFGQRFSVASCAIEPDIKTEPRKRPKESKKMSPPVENSTSDGALSKELLRNARVVLSRLIAADKRSSQQSVTEDEQSELQLSAKDITEEVIQDALDLADVLSTSELQSKLTHLSAMILERIDPASQVEIPDVTVQNCESETDVLNTFTTRIAESVLKLSASVIHQDDSAMSINQGMIDSLTNFFAALEENAVQLVALMSSSHQLVSEGATIDVQKVSAILNSIHKFAMDQVSQTTTSLASTYRNDTEERGVANLLPRIGSLLSEISNVVSEPDVTVGKMTLRDSYTQHCMDNGLIVRTNIANFDNVPSDTDELEARFYEAENIKNANFALPKTSFGEKDSVSKKKITSSSLRKADRQHAPEQKSLANSQSETRLKELLTKEYDMRTLPDEPLFRSCEDLIEVPPSMVPQTSNEFPQRKAAQSSNVIPQCNPLLAQLDKNDYITANGDPNAIFLLFIHIDPSLSNHLDLILQRCFDAFPDREYLITVVPHASRDTVVVDRFLRIPVRHDRFLQEDLYVLHRSSLISYKHLQLIAATLYDITEVEAFLREKTNGSRSLEAFKDAVINRTDVNIPQLRSFVIRAPGCLVGMVMCCVEHEMDYLNQHFSTSDHINTSIHQRVTRLLHYVLNPLLESCDRFILAELMRMCGTTAVVYSCQVQGAHEPVTVSALHSFTLVRHREVSTSGSESDDALLPPRVVLEKKQPFALLLATAKSLLQRKKTITERIVVIGASDTGLQELRNLALCSDTRFLNLMLVSTNGIPSLHTPYRECNAFSCAKDLFSTEELQHIAISLQCFILPGTVTAVDQTHRVLHVGDKRIPFDFVVLATGTQYSPTHSIPALQSAPVDQVNGCGGWVKQKIPANVFSVNDRFEAEVVLSRIEAILERPDLKGYFVVYGASLEAYGCVKTLLDTGIPADEIIFVEPAVAVKAVDTKPTFATHEMDGWVKNHLYENGVLVISNWSILTINDGQEGDWIYTITFLTDDASQKTFSVRALFNYTEKRIAPLTHLMLNSDGFAFDERLVISNNFWAHDRVLAGGSWCRLKGVVFDSSFNFAKVNSREIGDFLTDELLRKLLSLSNVTAPLPDSRQNQRLDPLPVFKKPVIEKMELPFGWHFVHLAAPSNPWPGGELVLQRPMKTAHGSRTLSTGNIVDGNICQVRLNEMNAIESIVCLTKKMVNTQKLLHFYGKNESWFDLIRRFEDGYINDLYGYLDELWLTVIFYDRFPLLSGHLRSTLLQDQGDACNNLLIKTINSYFKDWEAPCDVPQSLIEELVSKLRTTGTSGSMREIVDEFVSSESQFLTMYSKSPAQIGV